MSRPVLLLLLLASCRSEPEARVGDLRLGMSVEDLRALHPDLREVGVDDISEHEEIAMELDDPSGAIGFERGPEAELLRQYFLFREDRLVSWANSYDATVDAGELRARLEAEHGPPTLARTVSGSSANVWERASYTLSLLSFGSGPAADQEIGAVLILKSEPGSSVAILALILGLLGVGLLNMVTAMPVVNGFNQKIRRIESASDLAALKQVATRSMYGALVQIVVMIPPNILFAWAWSAGHLTWSGAKLVILANVGLLAAGLIMKAAEDKVKACPVSDELRAEKEHVLQVWKSRPFPKF